MTTQRRRVCAILPFAFTILGCAAIEVAAIPVDIDCIHIITACTSIVIYLFAPTIVYLKNNTLNKPGAFRKIHFGDTATAPRLLAGI